MRIGIFGGSFNPPHKMHLNIALNIINESLVDKVIFVPTGSKYKYKSNLLSDEDRYNMVKLITDKYSNLEVSNYELKDEVVYTCETLEYFKNKYPNDSIYFICGLDNLSYMESWKNGEDILNNYKILVINRSTDDLSEILSKLNKYKHNIIVSNILNNDMSSTLIRSNIQNKEIINLLDKDVFNYIKEHKLYEN